MDGKTVAIVGAGNIGVMAAKIYLGFGCRVLYYNRSPKPELEKLGQVLGPWMGDPNGRCVHLPMKDPRSMDRVCEESDVISIHILLNPATFHMLAQEQFDKMRRRPVIINVARGDIIDTKALVDALESGQVSAAGLDVVEGEAGVFFGDHSKDDDAAWKDGAKAVMAKLLDPAGLGDRCMVTVRARPLARATQLIPPLPSLFTRFRPYLAHFPPVFSRFLRVFTVSPRRFQRAASRNPGPRNSRQDPAGGLRFSPSAPMGRINWTLAGLRL
eukprot:COSAG04_NODE_3537_length_2727_cov_35.004186_2_plen_271_part_00